MDDKEISFGFLGLEEGIKSLTVLRVSMLVIRVVTDQANLRGEN
jgi:hypothetical protein